MTVTRTKHSPQILDTDNTLLQDGLLPAQLLDLQFENVSEGSQRLDYYHTDQVLTASQLTSDPPHWQHSSAEWSSHGEAS